MITQLQYYVITSQVEIFDLLGACVFFIKSSVLLYNGGPENFGNLSEICQKSVRKQSVTKMCQKRVINVSEISQKTVRHKYLPEFHQKRFRNASEMCQVL